MSIYREQQTYQLELAMNSDRVLLDYGEEHSLDDEPRLLVRVEEGALQEEDPLGFEARLTLEHVRALFRYLGGLVLPKVERAEVQRPTNLPIDEVRFSSERLCCKTLFPSGLFAQHGPKVDVWIDARGPIGGLSPTQARVLAACLLAAADEAEGVQG